MEISIPLYTMGEIIKQAVLIGRQPDPDFKIDGFECRTFVIKESKDPTGEISGQHCIIKKLGTDDFMVIDGYYNKKNEQVPSTNGTYINDMLISSGSVSANTSINLAKLLDLSIQEVWQQTFSINVVEEVRRAGRHENDYIQEFNDLEKIYKLYSKKADTIRLRYSTANAMFGIVGLVLGELISKISGSTSAITNSVVTKIFPIFATAFVGTLMNRNGQAVAMAKLENQEEFKKYKCPKCSTPFDLNSEKHSWEVLKVIGQCISKNCKAKYTQEKLLEDINNV